MLRVNPCTRISLSALRRRLEALTTIYLTDEELAHASQYAQSMAIDCRKSTNSQCIINEETLGHLDEVVISRACSKYSIGLSDDQLCSGQYKICESSSDSITMVRYKEPEWVWEDSSSTPSDKANQDTTELISHGLKDSFSIQLYVSDSTTCSGWFPRDSSRSEDGFSRTSSSGSSDITNEMPITPATHPYIASTDVPDLSVPIQKSLQTLNQPFECFEAWEDRTLVLCPWDMFSGFRPGETVLLFNEGSED